MGRVAVARLRLVDTVIDPLLLAIDALAVYRFSRLIVADSILDTPRSWLLRRWPGDDTEWVNAEIQTVTGGSWLWDTDTLAIQVGDDVWVAAKPTWFGQWLECVWCVSVWVAAGVVMARQWWDWWQYPALVAALSAVAGTIHQRTV